MRGDDKQALERLLDTYGDIVIISNMAELYHEKRNKALETYCDTLLAEAYTLKERNLREMLVKKDSNNDEICTC